MNAHTTPAAATTAAAHSCTLSRGPEHPATAPDRDFDLTAFYVHSQCPGAPQTPARVLSYAKRIWGDYADVFEPDELHSYVFLTLRDCFDGFDPDMVREGVDVEDGFVAYFAQTFRRDLKDAVRAMASGERRKATRRYIERRAAAETLGDVQQLRDDWSWSLYLEALGRHDGRARLYVQMHLIEGRNLATTARKMGVSARTVIRDFGATRLHRRLREVIGAMMLAQDRGRLLRIVKTLDVHAQLDAEGIAEMLCLPVKVVGELLGEVRCSEVPLVDVDECRRWLGERLGRTG